MIRLALLILLIVCPVRAVAQDQAAPQDRARGLELWSRIHQVFSHPRCANCHVGTDRVPMWSGPEYGSTPRPHGMNISAKGGDDGSNYLACATCHTTHNSDTPHGPPGALDWELPAPERQWFGKSSAEICKQFRDRKLRNIESIDAVVRHIKTDARVAWGWEPGPERTKPLYSVNELAGFIRQWDKAGAPCPAE